jgi:hypothetical protein
MDSMRRWAVFSAVVIHCGGPIADDFMLDAGPAFDATVKPDAKFTDGSFPIDAGADTALYNGGAPFLCLSCVCDGTLDMCIYGGGGGGMPILDAGSDASGDASDDASDAAPVCSADGGTPWCSPIPIACMPKPTCACIDQQIAQTGCACSVDPSGNAFIITCPPKP